MAQTVKKITFKILQWIDLSGYDFLKIHDIINHPDNKTFGIEKLNRKEALEEGCDLAFPYRLWNPYNYDVKKKK